MTIARKDFLSMADLSAQDIDDLLSTGRFLKGRRGPSQALSGKTLGMIFQKPSTRTAVSFAVSMYELGGFALTLNDQQLQIGRGETMADTARTLSRYLAGIMIRARRHDDVAELARSATIPVLNGLTEKEHPCQVLADLLTAMESFKLKRSADLRKLKFAYVGDGNNMAQSWMLAGALLGLDLSVASPEGYQPHREFQQQAAVLSRASKARVVVTTDPVQAVSKADVLYTDVWASMGQEAEADRRRQVFRPFQLNAALLGKAAKRAIVMHCLPAHRDEEITADVLEGPRSVVFEQAENRLHVQKAVLLKFLGRRRR